MTISEATMFELLRLIDHWLDEGTRESGWLIDCANTLIDHKREHREHNDQTIE